MKTGFLTNYSNITFLEEIKKDLRECKSFCFSVSFIKKAGLVLLNKEIEAALQRGCKGKLITSTYQNFTDIESLRYFYNLQDNYDNFECHLDYDSFHDNSYSTLGYHCKGYIFEYEDDYKIIIGSSNITRYALLKNIEWDLMIHEAKDSMLIKDVLQEFDDKWANTFILDQEIIRKYELKLRYAIEIWDMDYDLAKAKIKPNFMQKKALKELNRYHALGVNRALVVSSPGTGKTYLAAFDALNFNPDKLLYVVHESTILYKSLETFQTVFGNRNYGIYNGLSKEIDADFLFATNIILSKNIELFKPDEFDYIIIDECHHAKADTYTKIIDYFKPEFLLGLTATPERNDEKDVFALFDNNVPFELRLRDSIINDIIVPFHYYGISDKYINYGLDKAKERQLIAQLASSEHIEFVKEQINKYRPQGKLRALAFCKNISHARMMAEGLSEYYHTAYLTGKNTIYERQKAYDNLTDENNELEIICTVDILNEGIDIPSVNMVLFLRPTESPVIFTQQLGRGLRKFAGKEYVTVLDFIGNNYKRSTQIAVALGGLSKNLVLEKRLLQALVRDNFSALGLQEYGVQFDIDELSKIELLENIEKENFNSLKYIKQDYENFKQYINSPNPPKHIDYLCNDCAPDLLKFLNTKINNIKNRSYYSFLKGIDEKNIPCFSAKQEALIKAISDYLPLVRLEDYLIIKEIVNGNKSLAAIINKLLNENSEQEVIDHAIKHLIKQLIITINDDEVMLNAIIDDDLKEYLLDLIEYGVERYNSEYMDNDSIDHGFILWHEYTKTQVQRKLLKDPNQIQKGTYINDDEVVIFVSLKKDINIEERLNYKDKYLDAVTFQWESENNIANNKEVVDSLINSKRVYIFVRKYESQHSITLPFTYGGTGRLTNPRYQENNGSYLFDTIMNNELPDYLQYDFGLTNDYLK